MRNMPKELLNEYFDAFIGMTKQASSKYNITFADCKNIGPSLCTSCERLFAYGNIQKDKQLPFVKSNAFIVFKKKNIFIYDGFLGYGRNTSAATHNNNQIAAASMIAPENIL